ncbi:hypothetical protein [Cohnella nanjingensis]|uniref:Uncharacterized protein n=1 Tax=Cohnella nanjingensis TaxID=1387779 RepID=A0A7X0RTI5_9BACL|nr:hypothetical protein [Cohnella nanjingensis]MBB6673427.1 hypothetical protein [Cohnella nanjingensis]
MLRTFHQIKDKVDSFYLYDTAERHPSQFFVKENDQIRVVNERRIGEVYAKAGVDAPALDKWVQLEEPLQLKEVLKKGQGIPTGSQVTPALLKNHLSSYSFEVIIGQEILYFELKGQDKVSRLRLEKVPYVSQETKNMWLDQAAAPSKAAMRNMNLEM